MLALTIVLAGFVLAFLAPRVSAGAAIVFQETFEDGAMDARWSVEDSNAASGEDYWGVSSARAFTGRYSAWCAQVGNQSSGSFAGRNNSDPGVQQYDDNMQADLVIDLRVNGYTSLFLSFWYFVRTENGGGDWIQAWYEAGGVQTVIFNPRGSTGNSWAPVNLSVPNNVERLIIRFHTDAANHGFEGAYVDDVVLTGIETVPPTSNVLPLPAYDRSLPAPIPYTATDNPNASGVNYVELWYRQGSSGPFSLYTRPANPDGRWNPWLTPAIPFDTRYAAGDGYYEFYTIAVDNATNPEAPPANDVPDASIVLDATPPILTVNAPAPGAMLRTSYALVAWQASDATSGLERYETSVDGGGFVSNGLSGTRNVTGLSEGTHGVRIRAYDRAGNVQEASVTFVVDTVAPTIQIGAPSSRQIITDSEYTFVWAATDETTGIDRYEVWLDDGTHAVVTEERLVIRGIADGAHIFHVRAYDRAGNFAEAAVTFSTDKNPLSLTGPYRGLPLILLVVIIAALLLFLLLWWKRRKDRKEEEAKIDRLGIEPENPPKEIEGRANATEQSFEAADEAAPEHP